MLTAKIMGKWLSVELDVKKLLTLLLCLGIIAFDWVGKLKP